MQVIREATLIIEGIHYSMEEDGEIAHARLYFPSNDLHREKTFGLLVGPSLGYTGLGRLRRQVVQEAIEEARKQACYKLIAFDSSQHPATRGFYTGLGFAKWGYQFYLHFSSPSYDQNWDKGVARGKSVFYAHGARFAITDAGKEIARSRLYFLQDDRCQEPVGFLEDVFVDDAARGKGLGTQIVRAVIDEARARGCCGLAATSRFTRHEVHDFYRRLGFQEAGIEFRMDFAADVASGGRGSVA